MSYLARLAGMQMIHRTNKRTFEKSRYRGVQVNGDRASCCSAAQGVAGKRFLSHEVPTLPLAGCDVDDCQCTYQLFDDRRTQTRRIPKEGMDLPTQLCLLDNRNSTSSGRRSAD